MASGVKIDGAIAELCRQINLKKKNHKFFTMKLSEKMTQVEIEYICADGEKFSELDERLRQAEEDKECRWAVYDYEYTLLNNANKSKLVLITWCPEKASVKQRMVYSATKDALKRVLEPHGCGLAVNFTDHDECCLESLHDVCTKHDKS